VPTEDNIQAPPKWAEPPSHPSTATRGIQVWRVDATRVPGWVSQVLSHEELERIARRRRESDRQSLAASCAASRLLLAAALGCPPRDIRLTTGPHGKPYLPGAPLHFNLSHSGSLCLIALCPEREVGIYVEQLDRTTDALDLARRFFHPREVAALEALPEPARHSAFMRLWVCKEAYVKARGGGLSMGLDRFAVPLLMRAGNTARVVAGEPADSLGWFVQTVDPAPGYVAALATQQPQSPLELYSFRFENFR